MYNTIYLNKKTWDLELDGANNIKIATSHYAVSQDVASALRNWRGECPYNVKLGVPYNHILGKRPSSSVVKHLFFSEIIHVPDVVPNSVKITFSNTNGGARILNSTLTFLDTEGNKHASVF